ncbi:MAG TPA: glycosyltransferase [Candidatus Acidoferrum sp.]|jgi:glycosyltransferase involved in cell wall biosynthesis|nr:glycosyltransferase [Candidatus Acidoferrum sp.]
MLPISVIICTHNPRADYLRRTLEALKTQTLPKDKWELLLIDNASKDRLASGWDLSWHPHARHIREDELGLTAARLRGIREAETGLLVFLDDDNVAHQEYLSNACAIACEHTNLGCYGAGILKPEFEHAPSPEHLPYVCYLAVRTISRSTWGNLLPAVPVPWGAGLVVRRAVAQHYERAAETSPLRAQLDRKGESLMSGGDDEFSYAANDLNLGVGVFVELEITHLIDKRRVSGAYLERILFGNGRSAAILAHLHRLSLDNPFKVPRFGAVLNAVLKGHPARALAALAIWAGFRRKPPVERTFLQAQSTGWEMGVADISSFQHFYADHVATSPEISDRT